jgi:hypothetical protein
MRFSLAGVAVADERLLQDIIAAEGKGSWVWDTKGNKYLDLTSGEGCVQSAANASKQRKQSSCWNPQLLMDLVGAPIQIIGATAANNLILFRCRIQHGTIQSSLPACTYAANKGAAIASSKSLFMGFCHAVANPQSSWSITPRGD